MDKVKLMLIPAILFAVFIGIPKLISILFNLHSDFGLGLIVIVMAMTIYGLFKVFEFYTKEN